MIDRPIANKIMSPLSSGLSSLRRGSGVIELITNGRFASDVSGWTSANAATLSPQSGRMRIANTTLSYGRAYQLVTGMEIGKSYTFKASAVSSSPAATPCRLMVGNNVGNNALYDSTTGGKKLTPFDADVVVVATATSHYITLIVDTTNLSAYIEFDNISLIKI